MTSLGDNMNAIRLMKLKLSLFLISNILFLLTAGVVWADAPITSVSDINFGTQSGSHFVTTSGHGDLYIQTDTPDEFGFGGGVNITAGSSVQISSGPNGAFILNSAPDASINVNSGGDLMLAGAGGYYGVYAYGESLQVVTDHGLRLVPQAAAPTCDSSHRGTIYYVASDTGVADQLQVCMKLVDDTYSWLSVSF